MSVKILSESNSACVLGFLIIVVISLVIYDWWKKNRRLFELGNKIPGPPTLPIIGNAHVVLGKSHNEIPEGVIRCGKEYGNIIRVWVGPKLLIFLTHPEDVEVILGSSVNLEKPDEYRFLKPWLGNGLLISSGNHWRRHRKMIAPAFGQHILRTFVGLFHENALISVKRLEKNIGKEFDVYDIMSETTVDILLESVMGRKRTSQDNKINQYAMAVTKKCDIIRKRIYNALYSWNVLCNFTGMKKTEKKLLAIIHDLTTKVIAKKNGMYDKMLKTDDSGQLGDSMLSSIIQHNLHRDLSSSGNLVNSEESHEFTDKYRLAFLDLMVQNEKDGEFINDAEIRDEVNTMIFEGHDTTAASLSFTLCLLGVHEHIQEKVYEELYSIFGDSDRAPTFADTLELKYLERVILESLRLYPPVPIIARKLTEEVKCATKGYVLPEGCTVAIPTYLIHRRPELYPNPNQFNADNFLPENTQNRHYYSFIPFSAGPKICVGRKYAMLKLKVLLSTVLRNYKVKSNVKESEFKLQGDIILKRADGFRIEVEHRRA